MSDATSFSPEKVQVQAQSIGVPVGTVIVWTKNAVPDGWLECNGQKVNKALYPELAALMPNVPNYQGMFLRGAGSQTVNHGRYGSINHGTTLGQVQGDTIRNIYGDIDSGAGVFTSPSGAFDLGKVAGGGVYGSGYLYDDIHFDAARIVPTSEENRPVNVGVKYIIKAE